MVRSTLLVVLPVVFALYILSASTTFIDDVSGGSWDGVVLYISVKQEVIQKKLDDFHTSLSSKCNDGPRLFIPEMSVLPGLHYKDYHPVYVDFGNMTSHDFSDYSEDNPKLKLAASGVEVTVTIPLLAGSPTGPPVYGLAVAMFYERSRGDIPKTNFLYPYFPVDEIQMNQYEAVMRNGSDEFRISFNHFSQPCIPPTSILKEEFEEFIFNDVQFGLPAPDFSFCDRQSFESKFCSNAERIKCGVSRYAPNICMRWTSNDAKHCVTTVNIENITSAFRDCILFGEEPINILASESAHYNSSIALKIPCQVKDMCKV